QITLTGDPGDTFIIQVTGNFALSGGSKIIAGTNVTPANVLFNVIGSGSDVAFSGGGGGADCCPTRIDGTLLALDRKIRLSPGLVNGEVISRNGITLSSGAAVRCPLCVP